WKMSHDLLDASYGPFREHVYGTVYRGVFLRHSRDGHILLPLGVPKKVFLPFDIGAMFEIGRLEMRPDAPTRLGIFETAALIDLSRSRDFRRRIAVGPAASWSVELDRMKVSDHAVAPFSSLLAELHVESSEGRTM